MAFVDLEYLRQVDVVFVETRVTLNLAAKRLLRIKRILI